MDMAKAVVVTCHDSTWGNIGLDHVTKASMCQISVPMPGEALGGGGGGHGGGDGAAGIAVPAPGALGQPGGSCRSAHHSLTPAAPCLCPQRSARSWWSSSNAWSSSPSPGCSCSRTSRSSSAGKLRLSWSTPAAWRSWPSGSPPRSAVPGSTSSSEEGAGAGAGRGEAAKQKAGKDSLEADGVLFRPWECRLQTICA